MRVEFTGKHREYDGFFKLDSYALRFQRYDGTMTRPVERLVFERGDSAAVLLYDSEGRTVVLVEQFRLPAYLREEGNGTLLEVVAGTIEEGRAPEDVARCEVVGEAGFSLQQLEPVGCFYVSPGACTERIWLYIAWVKPQDRIGSGGGVGDGESIRIHEMPLAEALLRVQEGKIRDAKTIIALQHLALSLRHDDA